MELEPASETKRVLLVEDEENVQLFIARVLMSAGYDVTVASNGDEALAATTDRLDLLVADLRLPGLSGDQVAERLRQRNPALKVLYLTGWVDDAVLRRA